MFAKKKRKIDAEAEKYLNVLAESFATHLDDRDFSSHGKKRLFGKPRRNIESISLWYYEEKKFLGSIFDLTVGAEVGYTRASDSRPVKLKLCYEGFVKRGKAYFKPEKKSDSSDAVRMIEVCNQDDKLIRCVDGLDIKEMLITGVIDGEGRRKWEITVKLLSGAFVWMVFPPMKYRVKLPKEHVKLMLKTIYRIVGIVNKN